MRSFTVLAQILVAFAAGGLATISGVKVFDTWEQVSILWESDVSPLQLLGHPHMFRYMVAYPGFLLQAAWPDIGFSIYISFFFALNIVLLRKISRLAIGKSPSWVTYTVFIAAHLMMNGRGAIAWTSWLLCIWVCFNVTPQRARLGGQVVWMAIACLLSAVSTGVFVVVVLAFGFLIVRHWHRKNQSNWILRLPAIAVGVPLAYVVLDHFLVAIEKNIEFYGGGIEGAFNMLEHGIGVLFLEVNLFAAFLLAVVALIGLLAALLLINQRKISKLNYLFVLAVAGGLFGFTVLTLSIPPFLLLIQASRLHLRSNNLRSTKSSALKTLDTEKVFDRHFFTMFCPLASQRPSIFS